MNCIPLVFFCSLGYESFKLCKMQIWMIVCIYYFDGSFLDDISKKVTFLERFGLVLLGKRSSQVTVRRGIHLAIHVVMRVGVTSYGGGMDALQRKEDSSKTIFGVSMIDWVTYTFSILRDQLLMEEYLWWIRYFLACSFSNFLLFKLYWELFDLIFFSLISF